MRRPPLKVAVTASLQVAVPVGIAATLGFLVSTDSNVMTFAVLTTMLSLGFARIAAGPIGRQIRAMSAFVVIGGAVVVGIGLVDLPLIPSLIIFAAIAFGAILIGAASSYAAALGRVLLILMLMATALPAGLSEGLYRWAGMLLGGIVVIVSGLVLDRFANQPGLTAATAGVLDSASRLTRDLALADRSTDPGVATAALAKLRGQAMFAQQQMIATPLAVLPVAQDERSLIAVSRSIPVVLSSADALAQAGPLSPRQQGLVGQAADVLASAASVLRGDRGKNCDQSRRLAALERMIASDHRSEPTPSVIAEPQREWLVRAVVESTIATGRLATEAVAKPSVGDTLSAFTDRMRRQFTSRSIYFQNAVRTSIGVALALLVAFWVGTPEPWIVITPIMVLATSYRATFVNSLYVVVGVVIGVVISIPVLTLVGGSEFAQLLLIPTAVFLALFATMYIHVAVGNMLFALFFLTMQHLGSGAEVVGMAEGRAFQTTVGGLIGVVVALLVWQRGAAGKLMAAAARVLGTSGDYAIGELTLGSGNATDSCAHRREAELALENLDDLLSHYSREEPSPTLPFASVMSLASVVNRPYFIGRRIEYWHQVYGLTEGGLDLSASDEAALAELSAAYDSTAEQVQTLSSLSAELSSSPGSTAYRLAFVAERLGNAPLDSAAAITDWAKYLDRQFAVAALQDTLADTDQIMASSQAESSPKSGGSRRTTDG
ncbi:MAG: FUSC family protein [Actinobacteria bacterium]|nr:FUSC family protein [Actinomycetota bacterium]